MFSYICTINNNKANNMKTVFNFGGFYHSDYSTLIDDVIYDADENETQVQNRVDKIDFTVLHSEVAKSILTTFNEYINKEFDTDLNLTFVELVSPRSYNYTTDKVIVKITKEDRIKLDKLLLNNDEVYEYLCEVVSEATTSRPGYMPFHDYDNVMVKIDKTHRDVFYECLLDALYIKDEIFELASEDVRNTIYSNM